MRARWLVVLGATALLVPLLGGASSAAPVTKCPKGKVLRAINGTRACVSVKKCPKLTVTRTANRTRTCVSAARYRARPNPPSPTASLLRDGLTRPNPGLRRRGGGAVPRTIPPRLAAQLSTRFAAVESALATGVRATRAQTSNARSDEIAVTGQTLTRNADGSATGRIALTATGGGSTVDVAVSLTGRPTGALDVGLDMTATAASGSRLTRGIALRDVLGDKTPKCPTGSGPIRVTGGVNATARSQESFDTPRVKLGTVREATTPKIKSSAQAGIGADGRLQPIAFSVSASLDYSRSAQALAFFQSRSRAVATGTMTGTVNPATGKISGARISSNARTSGFEGTQSAADAAFRNTIEKMMTEEVARLRQKLVQAAAECGPSYQVTLALTTDSVFATHTASGTLSGLLIATPASTGGGSPARFTASGPLEYQNLTFASLIPPCSYGNPVSAEGTWTVTVEATPAGRLSVTWGGGSAGLRTTATVVCPDAPAIPGQPGPALIRPDPTTFELPPEGGQQPIGGGLQDGGDGFTHTGTMTVTRRNG